FISTHLISLQRYTTSSPIFLFLSHHQSTTEIYTLSLHDALPISESAGAARRPGSSAEGDSRDRYRRQTRQPHTAPTGRPPSSHAPHRGTPTANKLRAQEAKRVVTVASPDMWRARNAAARPAASAGGPGLAAPPPRM